MTTDGFPDGPVPPFPDPSDPGATSGPHDAPAPDDRAEGARPRRALVIGGRVATGVVALAAAAAVVGAVGLVPLPTVGAAPEGVVVDPVAVDLSRVCPGGALRLGEETGADADTAVPIGSPITVDAATGGTAERRVLDGAVELRMAAGADAALAGAQSQAVEARDYVGFAALACAEPSSSIWLVGGATTTGRTSILVLVNPTEVTATVEITVLGEDGAVSAPGMSGIEVPPGERIALSLAGFAPGLQSPVVHVASRGGQVVAALQYSIVRGLDAAGVALVGAAPEPATRLDIPGVRVLDAVGVARAGALAGWEDVAPVVRIAVPGDEDASVRVALAPEVPADGAEATLTGTTFTVDVPAGTVVEFPLHPEAATGEEIADGSYSLTLESDVPVLAAARVSTAVDPGADFEPDTVVTGPPSDVAWFGAATVLDGDALVPVADGPEPVVSLLNPADADAVVVLAADGADDITVTVPAGGSVSVPVTGETVYRATGTAGLAVTVSHAAEATISAYTVAPPRPTAGPITVRPAR